MGQLCALAVALVANQAGGGQPFRYLALGDSFTIGTGLSERFSFPSQLKALLEARGLKVQLHNVAVNGYSAREVIEKELPSLATVKPTHVTLAVGANDIVRGQGSLEYRSRLKVIFARLTASGLAGERLLTIPQPDWSQAPIAEAFGNRDELRARIEQYNEILAEETKVAGGVYVDLWPLMVKQAHNKLFAADGLHPHAKAYTAWATTLAEQWARKPAPVTERNGTP